MEVTIITMNKMWRVVVHHLLTDPTKSKAEIATTIAAMKALLYEVAVARSEVVGEKASEVEGSK